MCWNILPNTTELAESGEWISAQLVGAWYRVQLPKAFKMTKVMIEQRSWENSQIKEVAIKFDEGPSLKVCLSLVLYHLKMNGFSLNVDYVFFVLPDDFDAKHQWCLGSIGCEEICFALINNSDIHNTIHAHRQWIDEFRQLCIARF
jgi:hypothetical protein